MSPIDYDALCILAQYYVLHTQSRTVMQLFTPDKPSLRRLYYVNDNYRTIFHSNLYPL